MVKVETFKKIDWTYWSHMTCWPDFAWWFHDKPDGHTSHTHNKNYIKLAQTGLIKFDQASLSLIKFNQVWSILFQYDPVWSSLINDHQFQIVDDKTSPSRCPAPWGTLNLLSQNGQSNMFTLRLRTSPTVKMTPALDLCLPTTKTPREIVFGRCVTRSQQTLHSSILTRIFVALED